MCLAEALLRIPDAETADRLIRDKIGDADWAAPSRAQRIAVRQRLDLGADADRPRRALGRRRRRGPARGVLRPAGRALRRAGDPPGGDPGDAHPGPPVRHGPHHRGGAGAGAERGEARLPLLLRHAGRGGAHRGRRRALLRRLRRRHRRHRRGRGRAAAPIDGAGHLGQAVGAASALRVRAARPGDGASWCRGCAALARAARDARTSASPSTPRRPTGSTCRST